MPGLVLSRRSVVTVCFLGFYWHGQVCLLLSLYVIDYSLSLALVVLCYLANPEINIIWSF